MVALLRELCVCVQVAEDLKQDLDESRMQLDDFKEQVDDLVKQLGTSREQNKLMYDQLILAPYSGLPLIRPSLGPVTMS